MEYVSSKAIAEKWGISVRWVQKLCAEGKIDGAKRLNDNGTWLIPEDAEKPKINER